MWDLIGKAFIATLFIRFLWAVVKGLYSSYLAELLGLTYNFKKAGKWAVITGSTDGIGKAYAFEMAKRGLNIVLISRSPYKLQNVSAEITSKYKVETKIIDVDFTQVDIYDRIENELKDLEIGVLINNVGMSYDYPEAFANLNDDKFVIRLLHCNVLSVTGMCRIVLPQMVKRKKGFVMNISSFSSLIPAPYLTVYAATKAFVVSFSDSLGLELYEDGVKVQCVVPAYVATNMSKIRKPNIMAPTPAAFVDAALKSAGVEKMTAGYFTHKLQVYFAELTMTYLFGFFFRTYCYVNLNSLWKKAMKKKERDAKTN